MYLPISIMLVCSLGIVRHLKIMRGYKDRGNCHYAMGGKRAEIVICLNFLCWLGTTSICVCQWMERMESIFMERRGYSLSNTWGGTALPTPVTIILFIFVWGVMREKIQPFLPSNMASFKRISEMMVKKAIFKIKKRVRELEMS